RSPLPPGPHPSRGTWHAPTPGPLPRRPREALCQERTPRRGPRRTICRRRVISGYGDDVLVAASRGRTGRGDRVRISLIVEEKGNGRYCFAYQGSGATYPG